MAAMCASSCSAGDWGERSADTGDAGAATEAKEALDTVATDWDVAADGSAADRGMLAAKDDTGRHIGVAGDDGECSAIA